MKSVYGMQNGKCVAAASIFLDVNGAVCYSEWDDTDTGEILVLDAKANLTLGKAETLLSAAQHEFNKRMSTYEREG